MINDRYKTCLGGICDEEIALSVLSRSFAPEHFRLRSGAGESVGRQICSRLWPRGRRADGEVDQNRHKQLQKGSPFPKKTKNTPVLPFLLETQGFYLSWAGSTDKKRDSLSTVSLVGEAGLEPARPQ